MRQSSKKLKEKSVLPISKNAGNESVTDVSQETAQKKSIFPAIGK